MSFVHKNVTQMIGQVEEVSRLLNAIVAVSASRIPVLLLGPRSTGIDLLARALHTCSPREARPFVTARCGIFQSSTVEAHLLGPPAKKKGHGKPQGAAPGEAGLGQLAAANGGTLFVDQIQNTTPQLQSELVRVVTDGEYIDLEGATHRADIRLVASAWHDLTERVEQGRFRTDLFERLSRVTLQLRKGSSDQEYILEVADFFQGRATGSGAENGTGSRREMIYEALADHDWSEETKALKYAIKEAGADGMESAEEVLMKTLRKLGHQKAQSLAAQNLQAASAAIERCVEAYETFDGQLYETLLSQLQRTLIARVMVQCNGTISRAADILGVNAAVLQTKLRELGLE